VYVTIMVRQDPASLHVDAAGYPTRGGWLKSKGAYDTFIELPHGALDNFMTDFRHFAETQLPGCKLGELPELRLIVLLTPYDMSWDPVIPVRNWAANWHMASETV